MIGLYIHIPFCIHKCQYCNFNSLVANSTTIDEYIYALIKEAKYYSTSTITNQPPPIVFDTVYIGGGTPTILTISQLKKIISEIKESFIIKPDAEITIEANPGTIDREKSSALLDIGINRLSLGIQSFIDSELRFLGRIHSVEQSISTIQMLRETGWKNINLDLIFALPNQRKEDWKINLTKAVSFNPEHISTYNLTIEENTPLWKEWKNGAINPLDEDTSADLYDIAIDFLESNGYEHYEISNFAKYKLPSCNSSLNTYHQLPTYQCQHNLIYWTDNEYLGLGAGAHSYYNNTRLANVSEPIKYIQLSSINSQNEKDEYYPTIAMIEKLTDEQMRREFIFLNLRMRKGISLKLFKDRFGFSLQEHYKKIIDDIAEEGLVQIENEYLSLTRKGLKLADAIVQYIT